MRQMESVANKAAKEKIKISWTVEDSLKINDHNLIMFTN